MEILLVFLMIIIRLGVAIDTLCLENGRYNLNRLEIDSDIGP